MTAKWSRFMNKEYTDLKELISDYRNGEITIPAQGRFYLQVGNGSVHGIVHPGWDEDGEELGDPEYIFTCIGYTQYFTLKLLELLGIPGEVA